MHFRPLPPHIDDLLFKIEAPARLRAHLCLVHDVACQLTDQISVAWPELVIDADAIHLGAATHDIGKVIHPRELSEPGHAHEDAGRRLLLKHGWSEQSVRFTVTHGCKLNADDPVKDLLVAIADNVWRGRRDEALEKALVVRVATLCKQEPWQVWLVLDDMLTNLAEPAAERLRWQASHPS
jgi:hypothetical protein